MWDELCDVFDAMCDGALGYVILGSGALGLWGMVSVIWALDSGF